jgi:hypothetical protein
MRQASDAWFVRLPDGRVLRAGSTAGLRHHLESGEIPLDCRVRRRPLDEWTTLERVDAFADLVALDLSRGKRPDVRRPGREGAANLPTVGVRGLVTELMTALDSALVRGKLWAAALGGLAAGLAGLLAVLAAGYPEVASRAPAWAVPAVRWLIVLLAAGHCTAALSRMTFIELAHFRPPRRGEVRQGLVRDGLRLMIAYLVTVGAVVGLIVLVRWLPGWLAAQTEPEWLVEWVTPLTAIAAVAHVLLEVFLWPLLGFALLLGPIVIVEDVGPFRAVREWLALVRRQPGRVFLYEALAAAVAAVVALPFLLPIWLAALASPSEGVPGLAARATAAVLFGLALTPLIAYLAVANVFIYLTLRYEHTPRR